MGKQPEQKRATHQKDRHGLSRANQSATNIRSSCWRISKYAAAFGIGLQSSLEYRLQFVIGLVSLIFPIGIQSLIWSAVYRNSDQHTLYGYEYSQMILYTILSGLVAKFVMTQLERTIAEDIKSGGLNAYLIRPVSYFWYRVSAYAGSRVISDGILLGLVAVVLFTASYYGHTQLSPSRMVLFSACLLLAAVVQFLLSYAICALAFRLAEISYFFVITGLIVQILSGGIVPLEVFGDTLNSWFSLLPFKYTIYFPVNVLNGRLTEGEALTGLLIQCGWIALLAGAAHLAWRAGLKRYVGLGG
ncbi:ABC-2 family transporter protein [Paenibacillus alvei]|uniref:ABC-2 family transporter protein n=2 Tax=Paenibacillus alvei TaxID=44250 RepID=A0ABT4GR06_PAEAL|nr:ABC-2 family transporter protein [Paenibacillus alvei]MCY9759115.1 ABC-2 family transporter protein [Paenibacillus alvei]MCY9768220.1 ABC-2 family transporter protein [Paenibacillus alvei]